MYKIGSFIDPSSPKRGPFHSLELDEFWIALVEKLGTQRQKNFEDLHYLSLSIDESAKEQRPHIVGAGAEAFASIIFKVPFNPTIDTYRKCADSNRGEVRFDWGWDSGTCTRVKESDKDDSILIAVGGDYPKYVCFGWNLISELRRRKTKEKFPPPTTRAARDAKDVEIWVPRHTLLPIELLNRDLLIFQDASVTERLVSAEIQIKILNERLQNIGKLINSAA